MRQVCLVAAMLAAVLAASPGWAQSRTCTARDGLCRNECVKNYRNSAGCNRTCDQRVSDCKSTGCWGSGADARCGFGKT